MKYKRILIKVSGEAIGNEDGRGIDNEKLNIVAEQVVKVHKEGVECCIVIGAGNFWRGKYGYDCMKRTTSDYMGMMATTINALALQDMIESKGIPVRVQAAIDMKQVAEPYIERKAIRHLEKGRVVIFACGTGNPYFTTDTAAALRAAETKAEVILLAKNVDGVYNKDPRKNKDAVRYDDITYMKVINDKLKVMDATAITLCMENNIPILVFGLLEKDSIYRVVNGENIGTIIDK